MKEEKSMRDCFIICPIGDEDSEIRKRADRLLKHILAPVLKKNEFKAIRADQVPKVGLITSQIINLIIDSHLVVADLTGSNPNVFYELAIRHAIQKPYIQLIDKGEKIPFDVGAIRTIEIDLTDLDNVETAKSQIDSLIKEFIKGHIPDSPISVASFSRLMQHDSDLADNIADRLSSIIGYFNDGYEHVVDDDLLEKILRKVSCLRDYGRLDFEDLDKKLNLILSKFDMPRVKKGTGVFD